VVAEAAAALGFERPGSAPAGVAGLDLSGAKRNPLRRFGGSTAEDVGRGAFRQQFQMMPGDGHAQGTAGRRYMQRPSGRLGMPASLGQAALAARRSLVQQGLSDDSLPSGRTLPVRMPGLDESQTVTPGQYRAGASLVTDRMARQVPVSPMGLDGEDGSSPVFGGAPSSGESPRSGLSSARLPPLAVSRPVHQNDSD